MAFCRHCGANIGDAHICPECGKGQDEKPAGPVVLTAVPPKLSKAVPPKLSKKDGMSKKWVKILILGTITVVVCLVLLFVGSAMIAAILQGAGVLPTRAPTPVPTLTATPSTTPMPSATVPPSPTPVPSNTPVPTDTPIPAPTSPPTPQRLSVAEIERKKADMTALQWSLFEKEAVGQPISFSGNVIEVYKDGDVSIDEGRTFTYVRLFGIPLDTAAALNPGEFIQGTGTVREIDDLLGTHIWINVTELY